MAAFSRLGFAILFWIIFVFSCPRTFCKEVSIYDSQDYASLDWIIYPKANTTGQQWLETGASYNRLYQVCAILSSGGQNFWLRTPYLPRSGANRIHVEIEFTMSSCDGRGDELVLSCRETFDLYYIEANYDYATATTPSWQSPPYTKIRRIAADGRFSMENQDVRNKVTEHFGPVTQNGFYLAFQDQGACMAILRVRIYYVTCPSVIAGLARFPETITGSEVTSLVSVSGTCLENTERIGSHDPIFQCQSGGMWTLLQGSCGCKPGYQSQETSCSVCQVGTYKAGVNTDSCRPCPAKSHADSKGMPECTCIPNFYRAPNDKPSDRCTETPSSPRNVIAKVHQTTSVVTLSWSPPLNHGGRNDTFYNIDCDRCPSDVRFSPTDRNLNVLQVNVSRLASYTTYIFNVYARNGVSNQASVVRFETVNATTFSSVPSPVRGIIARKITSTSVKLEWEVPEFPNGEIISYQIRYYRQDQPLTDGKYLTHTPTFGVIQEKLIENLQLLNHKYIFQVRAQTKSGFGAYSHPTSASSTNADDNTPFGIGPIVAMAAAAVFIFIVILAIIYLSVRRSYSKLDDRLYAQIPLSVRYWKGKDPLPSTEGIIYSNSNGEVALPQLSKPRTYVDPSIYGDPDRALKEFTTEIEANSIRIIAVIGGGEFGDVCSGFLRQADSSNRKVAVKMLKPGASESDRHNFLLEASIMGQFLHPNVVELLGVVTKTRPAMIITEFVANGALDTFLREHDGQFTMVQLVGMLRCIASGMRYLSEMNYVHRDLAARNILVDETLDCKVADFGLSREKEEGAYETKGGGKIPVRWTSPEAISYKKFTSASDVWSYGIVMWEVMSYGERPYWNWSNHDVLQAVEKGYRLPPPMDCPQASYQMMLDCWQKDRLHRPTFGTLVSTLDRLARNPSILLSMAKVRENPLDAAMQEMAKFQNVEEWLDSMKMTRYRDTFEHAGYVKLRDIAHLCANDLPRLGINLVGHQKKIMKGIQMIRARMDSNGETFV
ncbi:ephrin type-B receptor 1-B-like isoform X2 [Antedon mediterranea]|uniref:ephrin type-B receptor 1-B-like isoform X2 n=1 Tax=Antedon mediterranea TaxID=105859 RepID=UPI003AF86D7E